MKAHIGVDARSGLAHTLVTTAGNVADVTQTHKLLHGDETMVFGDAGYQGADKRPEQGGASAKFTSEKIRNLRPRARELWYRPANRTWLTRIANFA